MYCLPNIAEIGAIARSDAIWRTSIQKSVLGVRTKRIAKTRAATTEVVGAERRAIPKSRKYVRKNIGEVKPPVVKRRKETANEKTKISKTTLDELCINFFLTIKRTTIYTATKRPEI